MPVAAAILSTVRFEERFLVDYSFSIYELRKLRRRERKLLKGTTEEQ